MATKAQLCTLGDLRVGNAVGMSVGNIVGMPVGVSVGDTVGVSVGVARIAASLVNTVTTRKRICPIV